MHYLWIREDKSKVFKSFLSGNEIEVGLYISQSQTEVAPGKEIEIFYGEDASDSYRAEVKKHILLDSAGRSGKSYLSLSVVRV